MAMLYIGTLLPAVAGVRFETPGIGGYVVWSAVFFGLLWRRLGRSGWQGAVTGAVIGMIVFGIGNAIPREGMPASWL